MDYTCPGYAQLGSIGETMNPLFIDNAVALGPTRVMAAPDAGYAFVPQTGLDGRHYHANYFEPGYFHLNGVREAMDVFTAAAFLFPE